MISSYIAEDSRQIDGRRHILEVHTDRFGKKYEFRYMAEAETNIINIMNDRAETLYNSLMIISEEKETINGLWPD